MMLSLQLAVTDKARPLSRQLQPSKSLAQGAAATQKTPTRKFYHFKTVKAVDSAEQLLTISCTTPTTEQPLKVLVDPFNIDVVLHTEAT